jgi:hypothetical protein
MSETMEIAIGYPARAEEKALEWLALFEQLRADNRRKSALDIRSEDVLIAATSYGMAHSTR